MCEYPSVYSETHPISRKLHYCCECLLPIPKGARYSLFKGCWAGEWQKYKSHEECRKWSLQVSRETGECIPFGYLIEDHTFDRTHHREVRDRYAKILRKYRVALAERKYGWNRSWDAKNYVLRKKRESQTTNNKLKGNTS